MNNNLYPLVSVILPIYNVKKFLRRGFEQVMAQTYSDYEVLLVDDGATDGCSEICDELAAQYKQVRVIHKVNGGLWSARNAGFDNARGKYVYVYDVDDCISPNLLSYCVDAMEQREADLMMFSFRTIETALNNRAEEIRLEECEVKTNEQLRDVWQEKLLFTRNGNGFVWNKFYRRSFLNKYHLRNAPLRIQQDEEFNLRVYRHVQRAYISSEILYDYYIYERGNNRSHFIADRFDIYKAVNRGFRSLLDYWGLQDERVEDYIYRRFYAGITQCLNYNLFHPQCTWTRKEKRAEFHRLMSDRLTQETLQYIRPRLTTYEQKLYVSLYQRERLCLLSAVVAAFNLLRKIKAKL